LKADRLSIESALAGGGENAENSRAISALIRCTTLLPVPFSRAVLSIPLPLASAVRIAASFIASILARPIGLPLFVPTTRARAIPA
jgi:hypothetical protein